MAHASEGDAARHWQDRANLLTPIAKAFATDTGVAVSSIGVQVHGGMGFIEETGAASFYRDARIAPIYEGTNGIQAIDLVTRKLPQAGRPACAAASSPSSAKARPRSAPPSCAASATAPKPSTRRSPTCSKSTHFLQDALADGHVEQALAGATPYLQAVRADRRRRLSRQGRAGRRRRGERIALCRFYCDNLLGETAALKEIVIGGSESLIEAGASLVA